MILIPEIQTVVILTPRTGTSSLRRGVLAAYPQAMQIYRHMEACGVPAGYDAWPKVGLVRDPIERLWSLYKFLQDFDGAHDATYIGAMRSSVDRPFSDWLVHNEAVFTSPHDRAGRPIIYPAYSVRHALPENRKSQFLYLRPDLGTAVIPYDRPDLVETRLKVSIERGHNATGYRERPQLTDEAKAAPRLRFGWDFQMAGDSWGCGQ